MNNPNAASTAIHALAVSIAQHLRDDDLVLCAALLTQLADTLASIAACRAHINENNSRETPFSG
ncbi:DUF6774 domain-containing protein [Ructibacterium gallinarum]|uniref:DUF6774 domain-containing protein n=1 Tax=Ructibacterium gallinarum TaxID=2779355 RepID=UPI00299D53B4|nr:DUF6774 domain-containing protein [Ructibacterium gallinarum]